jgi:DNA-binding response OmpR family regulator
MTFPEAKGNAYAFAIGRAVLYAKPVTPEEIRARWRAMLSNREPSASAAVTVMPAASCGSSSA